jgi:SAM-dependent methyltransferase
MNKIKCRFCKNDSDTTFVDLGMSPLCESYKSADQLNKMEAFYPLHVYVCEKCFLVQLEEFVAPEEIFTEYAYFSSYAESWVQHAKDYTDMIVDRFELTPKSFVIEIASNDGYLLHHFVNKNIPVLGVEPAANVAKAAEKKAVPTMVEFFNVDLATALAKEGKCADLIIGNNVLAQVPDINDFVGGMKILLKPDGIITMEFPHLQKLMKENQFDTIYHEHFSYFSYLVANEIFRKHDLKLFDVEELPTHGGSLRIYACHINCPREITKRANDLYQRELDIGFYEKKTYQNFEEQVKETKRKLLSFLIKAKQGGKQIVGYGAPGKGNTLLNYCGVGTDFIDYTVDRNPYKQGKFLPGTHIPIYSPEKIQETKPDYVIILPWNFKDEIMEQISFIKKWGGQFVVPIPEVKVYS